MNSSAAQAGVDVDDAGSLGRALALHRVVDKLPPFNGHVEKRASVRECPASTGQSARTLTDPLKPDKDPRRRDDRLAPIPPTCPRRMIMTSPYHF